MPSTVELPVSAEAPVPRLQNGDCLTRPEFHRRYLAMPELQKAELIEGIVYMPSPVRVNAHSRPHQLINTWLGTYWSATPGTDCGDNGSVFLDLDNEPQPDAFLRIVEAAGGNSQVTEDDYLEGPPELIFEIAASSVSYDLHPKKEAYRRNGVREYVVWRTADRAVDWWKLLQGEYVPLHVDTGGCLHSSGFPGLVLDVTALLEGCLRDVLARLQQGIASPQHANFVAELQSRLARP